MNDLKDLFKHNSQTMASATMKALNYHGPYKVRVEDVEKPRLEHPDDIIVKVTTVSLWPLDIVATTRRMR